MEKTRDVEDVPKESRTVGGGASRNNNSSFWYQEGRGSHIKNINFQRNGKLSRDFQQR